MLEMTDTPLHWEHLLTCRSQVEKIRICHNCRYVFAPGTHGRCCRDMDLRIHCGEHSCEICQEEHDRRSAPLEESPIGRGTNLES